MNYLNMNEKEVLPVVMELNTLLADYHLYYQKLRNFHWNILGRNFFDLHDKFEELYSDARIKIDEIAERILTLRYHPVSNYSEYLSMSNIDESTKVLEDTQMISEILRAHSVLIKQMNKLVKIADEVNDEGTIDLIGAYIRELEKSSWMLNAWNKETAETLNESQMS